MKLFSHKFTIFLSLSLIILAIFIALSLIPQQSPVSDISSWSTYTNSDFGYSVRYPQDWKINQISKYDTHFYPNNPKLNISIDVTNKNTPIDPVWHEYRTLRTVIVNGESVKIVQAKNLASETYIAVITRGQYHYNFSFSFNLDRKYDAVFDTMLSSFQPLPIEKISPNPDPTPYPTISQKSGWKSYISPVSHLQIQMPNNWVVVNDDDVRLTISNKPLILGLDGQTPPLGQAFLSFNLSAAGLENYSPTPWKHKSTEGVDVIDWGRYLNSSESFGITTNYRANDPIIPEFEKTITQIIPPFISTPTPTQKTNFRTVKLYYPSNESLGISCESDIYQEIQILATQTPIADTLKKLIVSWNNPPEYSFRSAKLANNVLTVVIDLTGFPGAGGSCNANAHYTAVEKTALQFPGIKKVIIDPQVFQP